MKNLLISVLLIATLCMLSNCSVEEFEIPNQSIENLQLFDSLDCTDQDPKARLTNNGTMSFDLEIHSMDGMLLYLEHNILPGSITSWNSFPSGEIQFSIENSNIQDEKVVYTMNTCMEFDMEIGSNNMLTSAIPVQL